MEAEGGAKEHGAAAGERELLKRKGRNTAANATSCYIQGGGVVELKCHEVSVLYIFIYPQETLDGKPNGVLV